MTLSIRICKVAPGWPVPCSTVWPVNKVPVMPLRLITGATTVAVAVAVSVGAGVAVEVAVGVRVAVSVGVGVASTSLAEAVGRLVVPNVRTVIRCSPG